MRHAVYSLIAVLAVPAVLQAQARNSRVVVPVRSVTNAPVRDSLTDRAVARLRAPAGSRVSIFADKLGAPRMLAIDEDGTLYVTRRDSGDVLAFSTSGSGKPTRRTVVKDLPRVHGIAIYEG